jgi:hypothetical protein
MKSLISLLLVLLTALCSCHHKKELLSDDVVTIIRASNHYANSLDTSAVRLLLRKCLDPRTTNDARYKGFSVSYFRLTALHDISGVELGRDIHPTGADTLATMFYLNWAIKNGFVKDAKDADIYYYK